MDLAQEVTPATIVIGRRLADMDVSQLVAAFQHPSDSADIPVLVIGGESTQAERYDHTLGSVQFLTEPFSMEELAARVSHLVTENGVKRSNERG